MFSYSARIQLHQTDAAGIIFYSRQFEIAHDAYEALMEHLGFPLQEQIAEGSFYLPIVHADADYIRPVRCGDSVEIALMVSHIGNSSFTLNYLLNDPEGAEVGKVNTVHVCVDRESGASIKIPAGLRKALESV